MTEEIEHTCQYNCMITFDCHDGYLHDMDYDYIDPEDRTHPCPKCNEIEFFKNVKEEIESQEYDDPYFDPWIEIVDKYCFKFGTTKENLLKKLSTDEDLITVTVYNSGNVIIHDNRVIE